MNTQEIFDKVVNGLRAQGKPSATVKKDGCFGEIDIECRYRSEDGSKCAAGQLIPNDEYTSDCEGTSWSYTTYAKKYSSYNNELIRNLQNAHDFSAELLNKDNATGYNSLTIAMKNAHRKDSTFNQLMEVAYELIAKNYGLKYERPGV